MANYILPMKDNNRAKMKTKIANMLTFFIMVMVLGTQTLLHGSWSVKETEAVRADNKIKR